MAWSFVALVVGLCPQQVRAQNGSQFTRWNPSLNDRTAVKPKLDCSALVSLTGYEFSVETASLVPAAGDVPEYCQVTGQILPEIRFEVSLPASWNNRFYMFGNGGYAGETLSAPGRVSARNTALKHGFAVAQTNTGHDAGIEPLGSFAVNRQKLLDYAWRAVHVTAQTAKQLIRTYYNAPPGRSYFDGCSTGGRQGLMSAQRFPEDFDGIVVGAPVLDFTGTMTNYVSTFRALDAAPIPLEKLKIVAQRVYARCDGADGLVDGLITDPRECQINLLQDLPICAENNDGQDCLTPAQVRALQAVYRGAESGGKPVFFGQPVGAEIEMPSGGGKQSGWNGWLIAPSGRTISTAFAETFFRYLAFEKPNLAYDFKSFNLDTDIPKLKAISGILDATNPDLTRFKSRGGKIIMYFGWADTALNPLMGIDYYQKVNARMRPATDFFRLFMVPGMAHCRGGVGTDQFDAVTALVEWVEKGTVPDKLDASQSAGGKVVRTRPLCPYPQFAKYNGAGSPDDARSFTCASR